MDFFPKDIGELENVIYQVICSRILYLSGNPVLRIKTTLPEWYVFNRDRRLIEVRRASHNENSPMSLKPGIGVSNDMLDLIPEQDPNTVHPRDFYLVLPLGSWTSRLEGTVQRDEFRSIRRGESTNNRNVRNRASKY